MIQLFKPKISPEFADNAARHVDMTAVFCEAYSEEHTLARIHPMLTPRFDNPDGVQKLISAFDFFEQFAPRLVIMFPSEKRAEIESFVSEFSEDTSDEDSAYYTVASLFLLRMAHIESVLLLKGAYRCPTDLADSIESAADLLCATYLCATEGRISSAPFIFPALFKRVGISVYQDD